MKTAGAEKKKEIFLQPMKSTQSVLPIKEIYSGIVITRDDRYIRILEIRADAFQLKTLQEQVNIAARFATFLRIAPANLQITAMTLPADLSRQLAAIDSSIAEETSEGCRQMCREYRKRVAESAAKGLMRRYFLSFEYEMPLHGKPSVNTIVSSLNTAAAEMTVYLEQCEAEAVPMDLKDPSAQTAEILYTVLNRRKSLREPFSAHMSAIFRRYYQEIGNRDFYVPTPEFIAPDTMNFESGRYAVVNGTYYRFLYLPAADGWCSAVYPGWVSALFGMPFEGADVNIYLSRQPHRQVYESIRRNMKYSQADMLEADRNSSAFETASDADSAGQYLRDGMRSGADFYYAAVMVTVSGESPEEVSAKLDQIRMAADAAQLKLREATFQMEQAFFSSLPLAHLSETIWKKAKRNMLTDGAASLYPFVLAEHQDENGTYLGDAGNTPIIHDLFNKKKHVNANIIVTGTTGAGKTYTLFLLAARLRESQIPVYLILPEKEHEARRLCAALDGQFIEIASGSPDRINVMDIFTHDNSVNAETDGDYEEISFLSQKVESLKEFFALAIDNMQAESVQLLDQALMETYERKGISCDNASLFADDSHTVRKEMPVISDLQAVLRSMNHPECERMANILNVFTTGSGANFNGHTNVNLDNRFIVFGLQHCTRKMLPMAVVMAMDYVWSRIKADRIRKSMLIIDEFWRFAYSPETVGYAIEMAKTIRGYNSGLMLATQQLSDLYKLGDVLGDGILNNCATKIIMKQEPKDADIARRVLNLTEDMAAQIVGSATGEGLMISGSETIRLKFKAGKTEDMLIGTDANTLKEYAELRRQQKQKSEAEARKKALLAGLTKNERTMRNQSGSADNRSAGSTEDAEQERICREEDPEQDFDAEEAGFTEWGKE